MAIRLLKYFFLLLFSLFLALIQFSFISALPAPWSYVNLIIVAMLAAFLTLGRSQAWFLAAASGFFLDIFTFHSFGVAMFSLFFCAVIVYLVLENWLTNRSLYSFLLLTFIGVVAEALIYNFLLLILDWSSSAGKFFLVSGSFWRELAGNIVISLILIGLFFNLLVLVSRRLKPFFLKRH